MTHTAETLIAAVSKRPARLQRDVESLGASTRTDPSAVALEITSMSDEQRAEALFGMALALGIAIDRAADNAATVNAWATAESEGIDHWDGPIGGDELGSLAKTIAAYQELVEMTCDGKFETDVRQLIRKLPRFSLEQMLLTVINETAVAIVAAGIHR